MGLAACRRSLCKKNRSSCGAKEYTGTRLCIFLGAALVSRSAADFAERQQLHGSRIASERRTVLRREEVESRVQQEPPEPLHSVNYNAVAPSSAVTAGPLKTRVVSLESSVSDLLSRTISLEDEVLGRTTRGAREVDGLDAAHYRGSVAGNSSAAARANPKVVEVVLVEPPTSAIGIGHLAPAAQTHGRSAAKLAAGVQMARLPIAQGLLLEQVPTTQLPGSTTLTVAAAAPLTTAAPSGQTTTQAAPLPAATPAPAESQSSSSLWLLLLAICVCLVLCGVLMHRRGVVNATPRRSMMHLGTGGDESATNVIRREFQKGRFSTVGGDAAIRRGSRASAFGQTVDAATRRSKYSNLRESRSGHSTSQSPAGTPRQMSSGHNSAGSGGGSGGSTTPPPLERASSGQTRYSERRLKKSITADDSGSAAGTGSGSKNTPTPPLPDLSDASVGSAAP